jgi:hypothetical protein
VYLSGEYTFCFVIGFRHHKLKSGTPGVSCGGVLEFRLVALRFPVLIPSEAKVVRQ